MRVGVSGSEFSFSLENQVIKPIANHATVENVQSAPLLRPLPSYVCSCVVLGLCVRFRCGGCRTVFAAISCLGERVMPVHACSVYVMSYLYLLHLLYLYCMF